MHKIALTTLKSAFDFNKTLRKQPLLFLPIVKRIILIFLLDCEHENKIRDSYNPNLLTILGGNGHLQ